MNTQQLAETAIRVARKRGLTFRIERVAQRPPVLHVSPKEKMTEWLRQAIQQSKAEVMAFLDAEGHGQCTGADGTVWQQTLTRCQVCQACDWEVSGQTVTKHGPVNVWTCRTCRTDEEAFTKILQQSCASKDA